MTHLTAQSPVKYYWFGPGGTRASSLVILPAESIVIAEILLESLRINSITNCSLIELAELAKLTVYVVPISGSITLSCDEYLLKTYLPSSSISKV